MALRISFDVEEGSWNAAADLLASWTRTPAPWQEPTELSSDEVWAIGPDGHAWFQFDLKRIGHRGSLLHLACGLNEWLRAGSSVHVIGPDLIYQSAPVELRRIGDDVEVTLRRNDRTDAFRVPCDDARRAVTSFLTEFGGTVVARLPGLRGIVGLEWLSELVT